MYYLLDLKLEGEEATMLENLYEKDLDFQGFY